MEKSYSANWRNRVRRIGDKLFGDLERSCSAIWRDRVRRFGEIVLGDLGVLGERIGGRHVVAYSPLTVSEACDEGKNGEKLWRPELY